MAIGGDGSGTYLTARLLFKLSEENKKMTVGSKEGWFEDIRPGGQVKVVYHVAHGKRLARTAELLVDEGLRPPVRAEPRVKSAAGGAPAEPVPTKALAGNPPTSEPRVLGAHPTTPPVAAAPPPARPALPEVRPATRAEPASAQATEPPPRTSSTSGRTENGGRTPLAHRRSSSRRWKPVAPPRGRPPTARPRWTGS